MSRDLKCWISWKFYDFTSFSISRIKQGFEGAPTPLGNTSRLESWSYIIFPVALRVLHRPGVSSGCDPARLLPLVWHSGSVLVERAALLAWQMGSISSPAQEGKPPAACPNAQSALLTMMNSTSWIESLNPAKHTHRAPASWSEGTNQFRDGGMKGMLAWSLISLGLGRLIRSEKRESVGQFEAWI